MAGYEDFITGSERLKLLRSDPYKAVRMTYDDLAGKVKSTARKVHGATLRGARAVSDTVSELKTGERPSAAKAKWGAEGSPEARAYRAAAGGGAGGATPPPAGGTPPKPGFFRGGAAKVAGAAKATPGFAAKAAGPLTLAVEAGRAGKNIAEGENPLRSVGRAALRGGATVLGGAAGAALGTFAGPVGWGVGGMAGGSAGYAAGDWAADQLFGPAPDGSAMDKATRDKITKAAAAEAHRVDPGIAPPGQSEAVRPLSDADVEKMLSSLRGPVRAPGTGVNQVDGQNVGYPSDGTIMTDRRYVPERGTGLIRGPGGGISAIRGAPVQAAGGPMVSASEYDRMRGAPSAPIDPSKIGLGDVIAAGIRHGQARQEEQRISKGLDRSVDVYGKNLTAATTAAATGVQTRAANRKAVDQRIEDVVLSDPKYADMDKDKATQMSKQESSQLRARFSRTAAAEGKKLDDLSPVEAEQYVLYNKMRNKLEKYRNDPRPWAREFFGNKRYDTDNLLSYRPAMTAGGKAKPAEVIPAERSGMPFETYLITLQNGNKISVGAAADGGWNLLGPNEPIDADLLALILPSIEAAQAKEQGR
jgi:hypothetical protein